MLVNRNLRDLRQNLSLLPQALIMSVYTRFSPSEAESQLAEYLLVTNGANWPRDLSFDSALKIFDLQEAHLRAIWVLADNNGKGCLSKDELTIAIRLIGWGQAGHAPNEDLLKKREFFCRPPL